MNGETEKKTAREREGEREGEALPHERSIRMAEALLAAGLQPLPMVSRCASFALHHSNTWITVLHQGCPYTQVNMHTNTEYATKHQHTRKAHR